MVAPFIGCCHVFFCFEFVELMLLHLSHVLLDWVRPMHVRCRPLPVVHCIVVQPLHRCQKFLRSVPPSLMLGVLIRLLVPLLRGEIKSDLGPFQVALRLLDASLGLGDFALCELEFFRVFDLEWRLPVEVMHAVIVRLERVDDPVEHGLQAVDVYLCGQARQKAMRTPGVRFGIRVGVRQKTAQRSKCRSLARPFGMGQGDGLTAATGLKQFSSSLSSGCSILPKEENTVSGYALSQRV